MHSTSFNWLTWRNGSIMDFDIPCREECILNNADTFRKYAIGYIDGGELYCRPKDGAFAIFFIFNDKEFWFHLMDKEFEIIFKEN